jgi:hypothetical protein
MNEAGLGIMLIAPNEVKKLVKLVENGIKFSGKYVKISRVFIITHKKHGLLSIAAATTDVAAAVATVAELFDIAATDALAGLKYIYFTSVALIRFLLSNEFFTLVKLAGKMLIYAITPSGTLCFGKIVILYSLAEISFTVKVPAMPFEKRILKFPVVKILSTLSVNPIVTVLFELTLATNGSKKLRLQFSSPE